MKRYADDYKVVIKEDEKGREKKTAVYAGKFFDVTIDGKGLLKFRRTSLILFATIFVSHVIGGSLGNKAMYSFYVAVPYVFAFWPLYLVITGILRLPKTKRKYRRDEVGLSFKRIKRASLVLFILLGVGVLGEIVFMIWFAQDNLNLEWIYLATQVVSAGLAYYFVHIQKPIRIMPLEEEEETKAV